MAEALEEARPEVDERADASATVSTGDSGKADAAVAPEEPDAVETVSDASDAPMRSSSRRPGRYRIVEQDGARLLTSGNAPNIFLRIERGLSVDDRGRKRFDRQTIFLDGVYTGAPFCNNETRHYSLDHHGGCVRGFTLATCEQAVVLLLQGLPLSSGTWTLLVNDPDLDSLLAAWVLLNHVELLRDGRRLLRHAMPVIRLEGVIDAHGTDREILTGFTDDQLSKVRAQVDQLMGEERRLKAERSWTRTDGVQYAQRTLDAMDAQLLPEGALEDLLEIQEEGRALLASGRIGVLLESPLGIYAVEERLKARYGASLGAIVLRIDVDRYTLRLVDAFLPKNLVAVYKALNRVDPKARAGRSAPNAWGGSADIGGSPRESGTGMTGEQILAVVAEVLGPSVPWWERLYRFLVRKAAPRPRSLGPGG